MGELVWEFEMLNLGGVSLILGMQVSKDKKLGMIILIQPRNATCILKRFEMTTEP